MRHVVQITFDDDEIAALDWVCTRHNVSRQDLLRIVLKYFVTTERLVPDPEPSRADKIAAAIVPEQLDQYLPDDPARYEPTAETPDAEGPNG